MLTPYLQAQFVERIVTSSTGDKFRVVFSVAIIAGELKAKVVSIIPVEAKTSDITRSAHLSLPAPLETVRVVFDYTPSFAPKISPYFTLEFFESQPTRAPSSN